ncbi:predicted protein [Naegleria gruberi]|uniref:Predicted protein n=1 Tax=Naegleria gruberi TaxID=5762 RepID=D2V439_NAEGR|nr:uncharacterized protein NAEGRDRAFT_63586 [Naegleria gruberi]EFC48311.1 predicted protein [Naegleria gruberi]|eukprot:XP_002681055.1 predicted protein [Naegleria gruberi strain NEG-M]
MLPSQTHLRRKRFHAWEYLEHDFPSDILDFTNEQLPSGFEYLKQDNYFFSEFDMAFPSGISDESLPNDIPDQLFDGINLCEELWENTLLCQLKKKYDKFCQKDIAAFLKCKLKRDHQIRIRAIEFETFKMTQESQSEISKRKELVDKKITQVENQLANSIKPPYRDVCQEQLHLNDLQFLELRKYYIEKSLKSD